MKITFLKANPYLLLGIFAIIFLLCGFWETTVKAEIFVVTIQDIDITIHRAHLCLLSSILTAIYFGVYAFFQLYQAELNVLLMRMHVFMTLIAIVGIIFPYSIFDDKEAIINEAFDANSIIIVFLLLFVLAQFAFFLQIISLMIYKIKTKFIS